MSGVGRSVRRTGSAPVLRKGIHVIIDCERCEVRDIACGDCVVGVLLGVPAVPPRGAGPAPGRSARAPAVAPPEGPPGAAGVQLDAAERRALQVLADQGLVPRLRLVEAPSRPVDRSGDTGFRIRDAG